jgi:hypothetical protein
MLLPLTSFTTVLVSPGASWLTGGLEGPPIYADNARVAPQDPSTLVLGLIGAATLGVYLAIRRRPRGAPLGTGHLSDLPVVVEPREISQQEPTRGAA